MAKVEEIAHKDVKLKNYHLMWVEAEKIPEEYTKLLSQYKFLHHFDILQSYQDFEKTIDLPYISCNVIVLCSDEFCEKIDIAINKSRRKKAIVQNIFNFNLCCDFSKKLDEIIEFLKQKEIMEAEREKKREDRKKLEKSNMGVAKEKKTTKSGADRVEPKTFEDRAYGCIIGAFIGDSCGSYLEFERKIIDPYRMKECMEMNGGGPF